MRNLIPSLTLALGALLAAAPAQTAVPNRMPALIASNDCSAGECVRQMLALKQFESWQQAALAATLQRLPGATTAAEPASTSCTWHQTAVNHWIAVCLVVTAEATCACILTPGGGSCLGSHPSCAVRI